MLYGNEVKDNQVPSNPVRACSHSGKQVKGHQVVVQNDVLAVFYWGNQIKDVAAHHGRCVCGGGEVGVGVPISAGGQNK